MDANDYKEELLDVLIEYRESGIAEQIDYGKYYLYSIITHSTAIEGSTVTEVENQLLFDEGITSGGRSMQEQLMNLDLKAAYEEAIRQAKAHTPLTVDLLKRLASIVMKNTGTTYSTLNGNFDSSKGDLRLVNVTAGAGGRSYMNWMKVPSRLADFCGNVEERKKSLSSDDVFGQYLLSFDAHLQLVTIHPWVDGNGRMSRLLMNGLQIEYGLVPTIIHKADRSEYIKALMESSEAESSEPFSVFMLESHIRNLRDELSTYRKSLESD